MLCLKVKGKDRVQLLNCASSWKHLADTSDQYISTYLNTIAVQLTEVIRVVLYKKLQGKDRVQGAGCAELNV